MHTGPSAATPSVSRPWARTEPTSEKVFGGRGGITIQIVQISELNWIALTRMSKPLESQWSVLTEHKDPALVEDSAQVHMNSIQGNYLGIRLENKLLFFNHITPNTWISL